MNTLGIMYSGVMVQLSINLKIRVQDTEDLLSDKIHVY